MFRGHANCLDRELAAAHVEEVFEIGPKEVDDEDIVEALLTEVVYLGDASYSKARSRKR